MNLLAAPMMIRNNVGAATTATTVGNCGENLKKMLTKSALQT